MALTRPRVEYIYFNSWDAKMGVKVFISLVQRELWSLWLKAPFGIQKGQVLTSDTNRQPSFKPIRK